MATVLMKTLINMKIISIFKLLLLIILRNLITQKKINYPNVILISSSILNIYKIIKNSLKIWFKAFRFSLILLLLMKMLIFNNRMLKKILKIFLKNKIILILLLMMIKIRPRKKTLKILSNKLKMFLVILFKQFFQNKPQL